MKKNRKYKDGTPVHSGDNVTFMDFDIGSETHYQNEGYIFYDEDYEVWYIPEANTAEFPDIWLTLEKKKS